MNKCRFCFRSTRIIVHDQFGQVSADLSLIKILDIKICLGDRVFIFRSPIFDGNIDDRLLIPLIDEHMRDWFTWFCAGKRRRPLIFNLSTTWATTKSNEDEPVHKYIACHVVVNTPAIMPNGGSSTWHDREFWASLSLDGWFRERYEYYFSLDRWFDFSPHIII